MNNPRLILIAVLFVSAVSVSVMNLACTKASPRTAIANADETDLWAAAQTGNVAKITELVSAGIKVNTSDNEKNATALHMAVANNNYDAAEALIRLGADVNAQADQGVTPLLLAYHGKNSKMVAMLLKHGAKKDSLLKDDESL